MEDIRENELTVKSSKTDFMSVFKFVICSLIGIFSFFVTFTYNEKSSILLDHIVSWISTNAATFVTVYIIIMLVCGAAYPFITKTWNKDIVNIVMSVFKVIGLGIGLLLISGIGPDWLFDPSVGPF